MDELSRNILLKSGRRLLFRPLPGLLLRPHLRPLLRPLPGLLLRLLLRPLPGLLPRLLLRLRLRSLPRSPLRSASPPASPLAPRPPLRSASPLALCLLPYSSSTCGGSLSAGSCSGPRRRARLPVRAALIGPGLARRLVGSGPFLSERADGSRPSRGAFGRRGVRPSRKSEKFGFLFLLFN